MENKWLLLTLLCSVAEWILFLQRYYILFSFDTHFPEPHTQRSTRLDIYNDLEFYQGISKRDRIADVEAKHVAKKKDSFSLIVPFKNES